MRIVHVTDAYLPRLGGIEVHVDDLSRRQLAAGHEVTVVTSTPAPAGGDEPGCDGPTVVRVPGGWLRDLVRGSVEATSLVLRLRPDVVHCHTSVLSPLAVALAGNVAETGVPTAVTVHSLLPAVGPLLPTSGVLLDMRRPRIAWSAVSEVAAERLRRVLGPENPVTVLPNAVDVDWWRAGSRPDRAPGLVRIVTVGRLAVRKRPVPLLQMMAAVRHTVSPDVRLRLTLVGDGPQRDRLRQRAESLGAGSWVHVTGRLTRTEIRAVLAASDLYVAPARLESFGIAALEARAVGLPVVAMAASGVADFVRHGPEGRLAQDDRDMTRALVELSGSHPLRERIRTHNEEQPPVFGWPDAMRRTALLYDRADEQAVVATARRRAARLVLTDGEVAR